jgi:hypothetical protein
LKPDAQRRVEGEAAVLTCLDERRARVMEALCEAIVPGSSRTGPVAYVDAALTRMPPAERDAALAAIDALAVPVAAGPDALAEHAGTPAFLQIRALAIEAYYSDFVAPGSPGPGAWEEIGFETPQTRRLRKDWSYLWG